SPRGCSSCWGTSRPAGSASRPVRSRGTADAVRRTVGPRGPVLLVRLCGTGGCSKIAPGDLRHWLGARPPSAPYPPAACDDAQDDEHHERAGDDHEQRPLAHRLRAPQPLGFVAYRREMSQDVRVAVPPRVIGTHVEGPLVALQRGEEEQI